MCNDYRGLIMNKLATFALVATLGVAVAGCQVNKTQEGKLPEVKVSTTGAQLPEYNVEGPKVAVGSKTETVKVPTVKVTPAGKN